MNRDGLFSNQQQALAVFSRRGFAWRRKGFTMIEMLIVVALIGILATIVIPRLIGAARKSKEARLRGDLRNIRNAIEIFQGDVAAYPPALSDIVASNGAAISANQDGNGISIDRSGYHGPYLVTPDGSLPKDPFTRARDWSYNNAAGDVHSSATFTAADGSNYSDW